MLPLNKSKKDSKDQESIQSSTTPVPGYQMESNNITINITNRSQEVSPFHSGDHKAAMNMYFAKSEDPDERQHNAAFHQGLHCL